MWYILCTGRVVAVDLENWHEPDRSHPNYVTTPSKGYTGPIASRIREPDKYKRYFTDCVGAIDGTHIDVHIPVTIQNSDRNRKGSISQNVLDSSQLPVLTCSFTMF